MSYAIRIAMVLLLVSLWYYNYGLLYHNLYVYIYIYVKHSYAYMASFSIRMIAMA